MSQSAGPDPSAPPRRHAILRDSAVILVGITVTIVLAAALTRRPKEGLAGLVLAGLVAVLALSWRRIAALRINVLLAAALL
jgi:hypothetical protein